MNDLTEKWIKHRFETVTKILSVDDKGKQQVVKTRQIRFNILKKKVKEVPCAFKVVKMSE